MADSHAQVVLIGAGHAHLHVARSARQLVEQGRQGVGGVRVTLVDPGRFWYSGLATGMLGGAYEPQQNDLDPAPLIEAAGGTFVRDALVSIDRGNRVVRLASGESLGYDALSLNLGSRVPVEEIPGAAEHAWPVKPISNLHRLRRYLETCFAVDCLDHMAVVGGGPTGCEVACNLAELARRHQSSAKVTLFTRASRLLPHGPHGASRFMRRWMRRQNIDVHVNMPIERVDHHHVTGRGQKFPADLTVMATGLRPPRLVQELGLPVGEDGGLLVDAPLHSPADRRIFGAGDCITFGPRPLAKVGVYGVRQGPILLHNLRAAVTDQPMRPFRPQRTFLAILNIGRGQGLALRGRLWAHGAWCMWWKDYLDRRFLAAHRVAAERAGEKAGGR
ncbi:MAG: FAD-dependent oxidoreductase [Phycisphaeraceae bacterium]